MNFKKDFLKIKITASTWAILAITRFFLAFIVLIHHLDYYFDLVKGNILLEFIDSFGGKASVLGFLLISGISIGQSYFNKKESFIKRRFLRIYPLYFFAVLIGAFLKYYFGSPYEFPNATIVSGGILTTIGNFLLLQGIVVIPISFNGPLWSLGVEFFLYLMVPLLFRLRLRYIIVIMLVSIYTFSFDTIFNGVIPGSNHLKWAWPFIIGFIISGKRQIIVAIPFLIAMPILAFFSKSNFWEPLGWLNVALTVIICFVSLNFEINLSKTVKKIFNYLGTISYPIYVLHLPILALLYHFGIHEVYTLIALFILITVPLNYIFDDWFKKIFWKPLINFLEVQLLRLNSKKPKTIINA